MARRLIIPDRRLYDSLWAAIVADPSSRPGLEALCSCSADATRSLPRNPPRQHVKLKQKTAPRPRAGASPAQTPGESGTGLSVRRSLLRCAAALPPWLTSAGGALAEGPAKARPADCLDQLFVQAHRVHPILLAKVSAT
jgi:hypothetical protein